METYLKIISTISDVVATVVIPLVIFLVGNKISRNFREKEIRTRYIELAVDVLKEMPGKNQASLREWAVDIINRYSEIPLPEDARHSLIRERPLTTERLKAMNVAEMKEKLKKAGFYSGPVDNETDRQFTEAVARAQKAMGTVPDGMYGPATERLIDEYLNDKSLNMGKSGS